MAKNKADWFEASTEEKGAAETLAHCYLVSKLEQNLIPHEEATRIIDGRKAESDEIWSRAVYGMLLGLRKVAND